MKSRIFPLLRWLLVALPSVIFCSFSALSNAAQIFNVIIIDPFVDLHTGPGRGYPVVQIVEHGEKAMMLKKRTDWIQVETEKGFIGWTHRDNLALTLAEDRSALIEFDEVDIEDYISRRWSAGVAAGDFGGADAMSFYGGYRFTDHLTLEGKLTHAIGNFSDSVSVGFSLLHETWPHWRVSPYFHMGVAVIQVNPNATLTQPEDRTDTMMMVGVGAQTYITRRFMLRAEYVNNLILTSRNENEEVIEWKIGLNVFF